MLPGLAEGRLLTGATTPRAVAEHHLAAGAEVVVVKDGARGATLFTADGAWHQDVFPVHVVDTVGAGDGFAAGLVSGVLDGLEPAEALRRGCAVGALATTSTGDKDGLPDRGTLGALLATTAAPPASAAG